ncbi:MAG: hypothetical protein IJZ13_08945 [Clostridia bacterium]|nr:hypothetical protein [Clostridia bacterium]
MKYAELVLCLQPHIAAFAKTCDALDTVYTADEERSYGRVELHTAAVEFVFTKKERVLCPAHTLFCRIYPAKNDLRSYHLPELWRVLEQTDFPALYFPYIESEKRLKSCFDQLAGRLILLLPRIERLAEQAEAIWDHCSREMLRPLGETPESALEDMSEEEQKEHWEFVRDWFENSVLCERFTTAGGWRKYVEGRYPAALSEYSKQKPEDTLEFEQDLCRHMQTAPAAPVYGEGCDALPLAKHYRASAGEFGWKLLSFLFIFVPTVCVCVLITAVLHMWLRSGADAAITSGVFNGICFAIVPAIIGVTVLRRPIRRLLGGQKAQEALDFDDVLTVRENNTLPRVLWIVTVLLMLAVTVTDGMVCVRIYEDRLESVSIFGTEVCPYADIAVVYKAAGYVDEDGEWLESPYYVLECADGTRVDLSTVYFEDFESELWPLLEDKLPAVTAVEALESED